MIHKCAAFLRPLPPTSLVLGFQSIKFLGLKLNRSFRPRTLFSAVEMDTGQEPETEPKPCTWKRGICAAHVLWSELMRTVMSKVIQTIKSSSAVELNAME